jgi:HD-GYP domain-containing protein (c-di-GMP phosphodiesterase class II)
MAHLIIWGDPRSLLAGGAHAGAEEVRTFAALERALDGRAAAALVLAAPEQIESDPDAVKAWLGNGAAKRVWLVAVADPAEGDQLLQRYPFLHDVVARPVSSARLQRTLERAFETMNSDRAFGQLHDAFVRRGEELRVLNDIGIKLTAERDIKKLLHLILLKSREITVADAGSLYLVERAGAKGHEGVDRLKFKLAQNDTMPLPFEERVMPLDTSSIAGYVAVTGRKQKLEDAYHPPEGVPFQIDRTFDEVSGYRSKSMLVVPMRDHRNTVIGVVQLINKKRERTAVLRPRALVEEQVIPFTSVDEDLVESLTSQAAVAFENTDLLERMRLLFDDFVHAAVKAIEKRDPTTSGHSERVAILTVGLMMKVDQISSGPLAGERYTPEQVEEVRYASLLHDFGKVAVQEKYLRKGNKLYASQLIALRQRFAYILKSIEADHLRAKLAALEKGGASRDELAGIDAEFERRRSEAVRVQKMVEQANQPTIVEENRFQALMDLPSRRFANFDELQAFDVNAWAESPYLSTDEVEALSIRQGSLSDFEREQIQEHVTETWKFLQTLPWTGELQRVPEIAYAHHEKLNGTGYPRKLKGAEIPRQSQMMTISDIFDALIATDRPYKKAASEEKAREILHDEARRGRVDPELLQVFLEAEHWQLPEFKHLLPKKA